MGAETGAGRCARGISAFCAACGGSSFCWKGFSCSSLPAFFLSFFPPKRPNRPPLFFSGFFSAFLFSFCGFSFLGWTSAKGLPLCAKGLSCAGSGTTGSCLGISGFGGSITGFGGTYGFAWIGCLSSYRGVSSCTGSGIFSMTGFSFSFGSSSAKEKLPPYSS